MIENAHAAPTNLVMTFKREIDFVDTIPLGIDAELGFSAFRAPAEQDAFGNIHNESSVIRTIGWYYDEDP
jgi:hypothetical protein